MKLNHSVENVVEVLYLSRSNLVGLLSKLDNPNSFKTIIKYCNENDPYVNSMDSVAVVAVEDEELYVNRK